MGKLIRFPFGLGELYVVWRFGDRESLYWRRTPGGWTFTWGPVEVIPG